MNWGSNNGQHDIKHFTQLSKDMAYLKKLRLTV